MLTVLPVMGTPFRSEYGQAAAKGARSLEVDRLGVGFANMCLLPELAVGFRWTLKYNSELILATQEPGARLE